MTSMRPKFPAEETIAPKRMPAGDTFPLTTADRRRVMSSSQGQQNDGPARGFTIRAGHHLNVIK